MPKLSVVIPVYYNQDTLDLVYEDLKKVVFTTIKDYELVLVDDGSGDESWQKMKMIAEEDDKVKIIKLSRNFGSHAACLAGLTASTGECVTIKAADLQEPSDIILDMYRKWEDGNKVVLAVREDREEGFAQKIFAGMYYSLVRKFALSNMPKGGFDCYLLDRKVVHVLEQLDETNSAITLQILWAGFKTDIVYYVRKKREIGKSKWTLAKKIKLVMDSLLSFSFTPIRFIAGVGMAFSSIAFVWMLVVLSTKIFAGISVNGWTSLMILILFSSGLILLTLGIIGEYLWRTLDASRNRPVYIIEERNDEKREHNET